MFSALFCLAIIVGMVLGVCQTLAYGWNQSPKTCLECGASLPTFHVPFQKKRLSGGVGVLCPNCNYEVGLAGRKVPPNTPAIKYTFPFGQLAMSACALIAALAFVQAVTQFAKIPIQPPVPIRKLEPLVRPPRAKIDPVTGWAIPDGMTVEEMKALMDERRGKQPGAH